MMDALGLRKKMNQGERKPIEISGPFMLFTLKSAKFQPGYLHSFQITLKQYARLYGLYLSTPEAGLKAA
jgi:hypothetical protein